MHGCEGDSKCFSIIRGAIAALEGLEMIDEAWAKPVRGMVRAEMTRRGMGYGELAAALSKLGVEENERNLRNKVARGTFSAPFLIQCLLAMDVSELKLDPTLFPKPRTVLL